MRVLNALLISLLSSVSLAAKKDTGDRFETYHAKSLSSAPLKFDDISYDELTAAPRDYSVAVLLTALEARFGCQLCRDFQPEWDLIGRSWARGDSDGKSRMLYGTLDFIDGKGTFQKVLSDSRYHYDPPEFEEMLMALCSSCCKPPQFCCSFRQRQGPMPSSTISLLDMTLQWGE